MHAAAPLTSARARCRSGPAAPPSRTHSRTAFVAAAALCVTAALCAAAARAHAATAAAPPPPSRPLQPPPAVEVTRVGGLETTVAHLPGLLLAAAAARDPAGRHGLVLLVAGEAPGLPAPPPAAEGDDEPAPGRPRALYFLVPGQGGLELLAAALPAKVSAIAALARTGGGDALLAGEPGALHAVEPPWRGAATARCRRVLAQPGLDLRSLRTGSGLPFPRLSWLPVARTGRMELLTASAAAGEPLTLAILASFALPVGAEREPWGLQLTSPPVHLLPEAPPLAAPAAPAASAALRFAVGPQPEGKLRLRTLLLAAAPAAAPIEAWSQRAQGGQEDASRYDLWEGRPVLVVSSVPQLGIFVKRDLQLFLLARDRSRGGSPPVLAVHTDCHLWQSLTTHFAALDGNGRQDLVLIHPEGLRGKKLRFQVWTALGTVGTIGSGSLAPTPATSTVEVDADAWYYGADLTGDGIPDLLVRSAGRLLLYPGIARSHRLADRPTWSFTLPLAPPPPRGTRSGDGGDGDDVNGDPAAAAGERTRDTPPREGRLGALVDLRGDGRPTLLLTVAGPQGRSQVVAVRRAGP